MQIGSYFGHLRKIITTSAFVTDWICEEDARTTTTGFFKARITFVDDSQLEFREHINISSRSIERYTYSFHYHKNQKLIFRFDNTPHHPEVPSFPHHKHIATSIIQSNPPSLQDVLREIEFILSHK